VALGAGFGLDFERCDPWVFEAVADLLEEAERKRRGDELAADLKERMGR
jgi:hypothetical protein